MLLLLLFPLNVCTAGHVVSLDMYVGLVTCVLLLSSSSCVEDVVLSYSMQNPWHKVTPDQCKILGTK